MEYDKEFEEWYKKEARYYGDIQACMYAAWKAARKDHYRIGEDASVWDGAPEWATEAWIQWRDKTGKHFDDISHALWSEKPYTRAIQKSRIDEIAEEAREKLRDYIFAKDGQQSSVVDDIIKTAILRALEEREAER